MEDQNPWWKNEIDEEYEEWKNEKIKWVPRIIDKFRLKPFSLHFLVGPRQIGKTTALKIFIHKLLFKGFNPKGIFYFSCDEITDYVELGEILDTYLSFARSNRIKQSLIILDEITFVEEWFRAIKARIDKKQFKSSTLIITGSASLEILKERERFPGRRGYGKDIFFLPMDFAEYIKTFGSSDIQQTYNLSLIEKYIQRNRVFSKTIEKIFFKYLETGGFPVPIKEMFLKNKVSFKSERIYLEWLKNDWKKLGKKEKYMKEIISFILLARLSPTSWLNISKNTSINSPHTVQDYVETLENLFCIKTLHILSPDFKTLYRKNKKIHIIDPFLYRIFSSYTRQPVFQEHIVESVVVSHLSRIGEVYFWKNHSEIDAVLLKNKQQIGFEVKWGYKPYKKPRHLKNFFLLNKSDIPLFLSSFKWTS